MNPTGSSSKQVTVAIIPARYDSTRLPGKPLLLIGGRPLVLWVAEQTSAARKVSHVIIATDDRRIYEAANSAGFDVRMTRDDHKSGTDRVAEVARSLDAQIIVNVQGDEPLIDPATIDGAVGALVADESAQMATTCEPISDINDILNPAVVKVTIDNDGFAKSFSRNPIPFPNQAVQQYGSIEAALGNEPALLFSFRKHTGLYVYRREFLLEFASWPQSESERKESLEQLRALDRGVKIKVIEAASPSIGVDTFDDLERVRAILETGMKVPA